MTTIEELRSNTKLLMFDQYGTVVDMQGGLIEVATPYLRSKGWSGRPDAFVTWWRRTHFENSMIDALLHKEHTPYREIGHRAVAYTLERAGIGYTMDEVRFLVAQIERLKPFPDVPAALARLNTRYKIAVLSNGDPDMLPGVSRDCVRCSDFRRGCPFLQTARGDVQQGRGAHGRAYGRSSLRRQPCIRLHRGEGRRDAHGLHRPPLAALRHHAAPAGHPGSGHEKPG